MTAVYDGLFARNPKVKPEDVEAVFCGTAKQVGQTLDIGRLAWLAGGYPEQVAANTICQQCPSGMSALEHAARAIMVGDGDTYIVAGCEDMLAVPMSMGIDFAPRLAVRYAPGALTMGATAEKVAEVYNVDPHDMRLMALYSNREQLQQEMQANLTMRLFLLKVMMTKAIPSWLRLTNGLEMTSAWKLWKNDFTV